MKIKQLIKAIGVMISLVSISIFISCTGTVDPTDPKPEIGADGKISIWGSISYPSIETASGTAKTEDVSKTGINPAGARANTVMYGYAITSAAVTGVTVNPSNGQVAVAADAAAGNHNVMVTATVDSGHTNYKGSVTGIASITIPDAGKTSIAGTISYTDIASTFGMATNGAVNKTGITPAAAYADAVIYSYAIVGDAVAGITVHPTTGEIMVAAHTFGGVHNLTVKASVDNGDATYTSAVTGTVKVTISKAMVGGSISYSAISAGFGTVASNNVVKTAITPSVAQLSTYGYAVTAGAVTGITVVGATGQIMVAANTAVGTYTNEITATVDSGDVNFQGTVKGTVMVTVAKGVVTGFDDYADFTAVTNEAITAQAARTTTPATATGTYSIKPALPAGINLIAATGVISGTATATAASAVYVVTFVANGNFMGTVTQNITIEVLGSKTPITGLSYSAPSSLTVGTAMTAMNPTTTPAGATGTYAVTTGNLPDGIVIAPATGIISGTPEKAEGGTTVVVTITATEGFSGTSTESIIFPTVEAAAVTKTSIGGNITYSDTTTAYGTEATKAVVKTGITPPAAYANTVTYGYAITSANVTGIGVHATSGLITAASSVAVGIYDVTVTATVDSADATYTGSVTGVAKITVAGTGGKTSITGSISYADTSAVSGTAVTQAVIKTGINPSGARASTYGYAITGTGVTGVTVNGTSGLISAASSVAVGVHNVTVTATISSTDAAYSGSVTGAAKITVTSGTTPVTSIAYSAPASLKVNTAITAMSPTKNPAAATGTYAVTTGTLPPGLDIASATGIITGTPTAPKTATTGVTVRLTASGSFSGTADATITFPAVSKIAVTGFNDYTDVTVTAGTAITTQVARTKVPTGATGSFAVAPALPGGISLVAATGVISGTPAAAIAAANYTVTFTGSGNYTGTTTQNIRITVSAAAKTSIGGSISYTDTATTSGTAATKAVVKTGITPAAARTKTYGYAITGTGVAGITVNGTSGLITAANTVAVGVHNVTVRATVDNADATYTGSVTGTAKITVNAPVVAPMIQDSAGNNMGTTLTAAPGKGYILKMGTYANDTIWETSDATKVVIYSTNTGADGASITNAERIHVAVIGSTGSATLTLKDKATPTLKHSITINITGTVQTLQYPTGTGVVDFIKWVPTGTGLTKGEVLPLGGATAHFSANPGNVGTPVSVTDAVLGANSMNFLGGFLMRFATTGSSNPEWNTHRLGKFSKGTAGSYEQRSMGFVLRITGKTDYTGGIVGSQDWSDEGAWKLRLITINGVPHLQAIGATATAVLLTSEPIVFGAVTAFRMYNDGTNIKLFQNGTEVATTISTTFQNERVSAFFLGANGTNPRETGSAVIIKGFYYSKTP